MNPLFGNTQAMRLHNALQEPGQRHLTWEGCYNTRDLGGLPTVDGGETDWQAVIRSDILSRLTAQGRRALLDYHGIGSGVRTRSQ
jgi:hypothetical protein